MATSISRGEVLSYRIRTQQLDRSHGTTADTAILDIGVQDTGPDGGLWALAPRGVDVTAIPETELATAWTLRGAPHLYRRADLASVAAAVQPYSEADAAKRILDAAKPLKAAGISPLAALDTVAQQMRDIVTEPMVKGAVSTALTARLDTPYVRFCRPCGATHSYEMTFRLGALRGGLELQPGTSPPVLERIPGHRAMPSALPQHDVVRACLHLLGPLTPRQVAGYLDAPAKDVVARWPDDVEPVEVAGEERWVLSDDLRQLRGADAEIARLLGPYDLFLQARDRGLLVDDPGRAKALWPVLGRPGAVLLGRELAGLWRPRRSGSRLNLAVTPWRRLSAADRRAVTEQAERLAAFRGLRLGAVEVAG